ncbi:MAG: Crp/Fnr family transcriptional regulator, partial [Burkholderiaceae bacterium]|nr:Crp/Fnr family transcriptional regulator [Burkholderiaceae bacterium]
MVNYPKTHSSQWPSIAEHAERNVIRLQLAQNIVLKLLAKPALAELEAQLVVQDLAKGDTLVRQGDHDMAQCFILDGILKRVVASPSAKEMILRFAFERDLETSYAAWRLHTPTPYSIVTVTKARVATLPLPDWVAFMQSRPELKAAFEYEVMSLMSDVMAHTITLHLLDAPGRVHRFMRKHAELAERLPKK